MIIDDLRREKEYSDADSGIQEHRKSGSQE
jgi:hypothetical protein